MKRLIQATQVISVAAGSSIQTLATVTVPLMPGVITRLLALAAQIFENDAAAKISMVGLWVAVTGFKETPQFANFGPQGPTVLPLLLPQAGIVYSFPDLTLSEWDTDSFQQNNLSIAVQAGVNNTDVAAHGIQTSFNVVYELLPRAVHAARFPGH